MNRELYHYGVLGMKWGIRKAQKDGIGYVYKSHTTNKYEKKAEKLRGTNSEKSRIMAERAKRSAKHDAIRQQMAEKTSTGTVFATRILGGGFASRTITDYQRAKAGGMSSGKALVDTILFGGIGGRIAKARYIRSGERKK